MAIDKAITYLKKKAPKGEFLAYINKKEAAILKKAGGSGELVNGIPSYRSAKGMASKEKSRNYSSPSKSPSRSPRGPQELGTSTRTVNRTKAPPPTTRIGGKTYNVTPETRGDRDRATLKQQLMKQPLGGNRIDKFGNTKKNLFRGGGGGIGSLIASIIGMAMGIPGLGLLTGGFGKLKQGLGSLGDTLGDFRENFTGFKTQAEYDQAMIDRRQQKRLDKLFAVKDRGYNQIGFGDFTKKTMDFTPGQQAKIDDLLAQGYKPSTARNVLTGRDLKGFTESKGLQTPIAKPIFSDPFRNTVGTTANTTNDAVSSNNIPTVNGVPMINTGSVYQDNLNFFDNLNKGIVKNNEPPMVNTDNVMQGSVLNAKPKKGIMQMISDAFISPAGAADLSEDELNIQRALNAKSYKDTIKEVLPGNEITAGGIPDLNNPDVLNNIATSTGMPMEGYFNKTPTTQTTRDIKSIQNYKRDPDLQFNVNDIMEYGIGQRLGQPQIQSIYDMVRAPGQTPFLAADGGLASMFTRRE